MSPVNSITSVDRRVIEDLLDMSGGYVLDFNNPQFVSLFADRGIEIFSERFSTEGTSKAKRMRSFLQQAPDGKIGEVLYDLLRHYDYLHSSQADTEATSTRNLFEGLVRRLRPDLLGKPWTSSTHNDEERLLELQFDPRKLPLLPIDSACGQLLVARMAEAENCVKHGSHLASVILCGSVLEAICLGYGQKHPEEVNRAYSTRFKRPAPSLWEIKLTEWIDVLCETGAFTPNIGKFGHALREFRNYVHPYQQLNSGFTPDQHTAKISFQVVVAAIDNILTAQGAKL